VPASSRYWIHSSRRRLREFLGVCALNSP